MMIVRMPRKPRYNIIREPPKDAGTEETTVGSTTRGTQTSREQSRDRAPPISSSANRAPTTHINEPFRAPHIDHRNAQLNDGVRKVSKLSVKEAIALPSNTKIVLPFNNELQLIGQAAGLLNGFIESLGADYSQFPHILRQLEAGEQSKERTCRVFYYEDDARGKIKCDILKRIGKNWKDTRHHLFHRCYKQIRTYEENLQHHPKEIDKNNWKKFVDYRLNEETQKKCKQNTLNRSKQLYTHIGSSKTLAREKDEVEREQGRSIGRVELFIMTHKKKDGSYIHPDAHVISDGSSKHLSQNDSLAQVLGKKHPGRVRALGAGPCPTQVFGNAAGQPSGFVESNAEDKRMIAELTAKLEEERAKRQSIHKVLGYVVQQLGGNLLFEIAEEMVFVGDAPDSSCAGPSSSGNHHPQQKS
ncbi:uncharacterized protein LOC127740556 [Arachis duranensis]|uniref:Uncharacterized protein LOC127740556 n=1 Tax=Arachis duranensis TaxID=130453 RepID=A0A9C6T0I3_ARADU|nr:uncharacterized protein LOC112758433 [Arachis hypogaea]XP_052107561.1 uncharacterized protein LOC127740556 [Arachis duranensis]